MKIESTRRTFLVAGAGIAGLSAIDVVPAGAVIDPEPWGIKLGIASYSFREFARKTMLTMAKQIRSRLGQTFKRVQAIC